jgi:hypothetical protein
MVHIVWLIGVLFIAWGLTAILKPELIKRAVKFFSSKKNYLIAAGIRLLLGVLFLVFAYGTRMRRVTLFLGLLFLAGGILLLVLPPAKVHSILTWWSNQRVWVFRLLGVVVVLFGVLVIWAGWPA